MDNKFREVFPRESNLLVVIHAKTSEQVLRNVEIAYAQGADGVFLINHDGSSHGLLRAYWDVRRDYPDWWIGLNVLGEANTSVLGLAGLHDIAGIWVDDAGVVEQGDGSIGIDKAHYVLQQRRDDWDGLYFGGVAFKYREPVKHPGIVAEAAIPFVNVITTSGDVTGAPPSVEKIRVMRNAIGDFPLAIASGITSENVSDYLPFANCFLVATGIRDSFTELNAARVGELAQIIRQG